ncbi:MAG TPA: DUF2721 domain-containing protein [Polyangia bacterium]|jgi:hypothetical protein|nr:DUF2721 domain-containing protein [Polyangia bacterium]
MNASHLSELLPALQVAVAPVILISGVGLLLLSLTNRFGRAVDRARHLRRDLGEASDTERRQLTEQVDNLYRRARLIRTAIVTAAASELFAALLIITLFVEQLLSWPAALAVGLLFVFCLGALIVSLVAFMLEIRLSLAALKLELGRR